MEYFCFEGDGLWSSTDAGLIELATKELTQLGICKPGEVLDGSVVRMQKAYPVYDDEYLKHVAVIRDWLRTNLRNLHLAGRNGMHKYNNQDHSMMTGLVVARNIAAGSLLDPWKVNTDAQYHEEGAHEGAGRQAPARVPS
jgi:protoporphyrinogen oxidase